MRTFTVALVIALCGCGGTDGGGGTPLPDGGTQRGVPGTAAADAGVWSLSIPCSGQNFAMCPFQDAGGTCYGGNSSPRNFCGLPPPCPAGTEIGTNVRIGMCLKPCSAAADCPQTTFCFQGLCVPY